MRRRAGVPVAAWDRFASLYDLQLRLERPALHAALELAAVQPHERLLDAGTGTAALLRELARRPGRPSHAVGVDASPRMLARAGELPDDWQLLRADVRALPFGDRSFDVATAAYLLHVLGEASRAEVLAELRRVLAPAGRLVAVTPAAPASRLSRLAAWLLGALIRLGPSVLEGLRPLDPRPELERAGFRVLAIQQVGSGYRSICVLAEAPGR